MGQTLPNGIYLPAEGERNCYDGLEGNWRSLDSLISTVAGKASATHTHGNISNDGKVGTTANKPLITGTGGAVQAGSFGNQANTFCEGNDSRLSDARTPVAHTHTKSDVTDLLNSNFIPSANNSYDLGSSSYQWNNLYAKNYYYNGTAWGLDKANEWTKAQTYSAGSYGQMIWLKNTDLDLSVNGNTGLSSNYQHMIHWVDNNNTPYSTIQSWTNNSENVLVLRSRYRTDANTVRISSIRNQCTANAKRWYPESNGDTDLGTSTNKWATLNGINPGALSLPKTESGRYSFTDLSSISGIGVDSWVLDGGKIVIAAEYVITGWLYVCIACNTDGYVILQTGSYSYPNCFYKVTGTPITGYASAMIPIVESIAVTLYLKGTSLLHARYYPAAGNV